MSSILLEIAKLKKPFGYTSSPSWTGNGIFFIQFDSPVLTHLQLTLQRPCRTSCIFPWVRRPICHYAWKTQQSSFRRKQSKKHPYIQKALIITTKTNRWCPVPCCPFREVNVDAAAFTLCYNPPNCLAWNQATTPQSADYAVLWLLTTGLALPLSRQDFHLQASKILANYNKIHSILMKQKNGQG